MRKKVMAAAMLLMSVPVWAQRAFDVVSVHEEKRAADGSITMRVQGLGKESSVELDGMTIGGLISMAYRVDGRNVTGVPEWARDMYFQVKARAEVFASPEGQKWSGREAYDIKREMLRMMLAERFHLVVHTDRKEASGFELRVSPKGNALVPAEPAPAGEDGKPKPAPYSESCGQRGCDLKATRISMRQFAALLSGQMHVTVLDQTGLPETNGYVFHLQWRPRSQDDSAENEWPTIEAAVKELGLELKPVKVMEDVVVVEKVERVSEN